MKYLKKKIIFTAILAYIVFCLFYCFILSNVFAASPVDSYETVNTSVKLHNPSIYGLLTSKRWAYGEAYQREDLKPVANTNPYPEPQPDRDRPNELAITKDGKKLYITLLGTELNPGTEVLVFDVAQKEVRKRIKVGLSPYHLKMHPGGRFLVVINRFSNYASVIDTYSDRVVSEIPLDFYCQRITFNKEGTVAYISNRYLNQIFLVDIHTDKHVFEGKMRLLGGFDEQAFQKNIYPVLHESCGTSGCHSSMKGDFYAGDNQLEAFFSAMENSIPGNANDSIMLKAVRSVKEGGFADDLGKNNFHIPGSILSKSDEKYQKLEQWINSTEYGPGIPVGNFGSKPHSLYISHDGKYLYAGNRGTQDISIIDLEKNQEVSGIYTQNIILDIAGFNDPEKNKEFLIALSMGAGFGVAKERDPLGGETEDPDNPAVQFTLLRDIETTEPLSIEEQSILGKFDGTDGTAAIKMSDIQSDVILVDAKSLDIPENPGESLSYALKANRYEAHKAWVRYTSDSAEILPHDYSGDIPPELQRVIGAYPVNVKVDGNKVYILMQDTYKVVEWQLKPSEFEPSDYLTPVAVYDTGIMPKSLVYGPKGTIAEDMLFVTNFFGETISIINKSNNTSEEFVVGNLSRPYPDTNAERGEMFVNTAIFSGDKDIACTSCHIDLTSDARGWGAGQSIAQMRDGKFVNGGMLSIPQIKNLFAIQPFYFEGTHGVFDAQFDDAREQVPLQAFLEANPQMDTTDIFHPLPVDQREKEHEEIQDKMSNESFGDIYADLKERRDEMIRKLTIKYFGKAFNFRDFQRFIGEYQASATRLNPNPYDQNNRSAIRGKRLFNRLDIACVVCHTPPSFANKDEELYDNHERTLPPLVSFTKREKAFTLVGPHWMDRANNFKRDLEYWEEGRVEREQGHLTTFQLRGLFDRPFAFLHHGRALSIREAISAPDHYALRKFKYPVLRGGELVRLNGRERGFNEQSIPEEKTYIIDTRGATSYLSTVGMQDLENFLLSIE
jgi:6-phosphogluconolactonase (cycloisomerase 2 family)